MKKSVVIREPGNCRGLERLQSQSPMAEACLDSELTNISIELKRNRGLEDVLKP